MSVLTALVFGCVAGFVGLLFGPSMLKQTRFGSRAGQGYFEFVCKSLKRPSYGVNKRGHATLRQMSFDSIYDQETFTEGGVEKKITQTGKNIHRVGKTPFGFFDEVFGVTFDLRDLHIGQLSHRLRDDGQMAKTAIEYDENGVPTSKNSYVRAFYEVTGRRGLDFDLDESVRPIIDGSEKADWWDYMWESVRRMYIHRQEDLSVIKLILPLAVSVAALFAGYYLFGPGVMPWSGGSGGGGPSPVTVGGTLLLVPTLQGASTALRERVPWRKIGYAILALVLSFGATFGALTVGPAVSAWFVIGVVIGAAIIPVLTAILGAVGKGAGLADVLVWAGLGGFEEPTLDLTEDDRYVFVEASDIGLEGAPKVKLSKRLVSLSCETTPRAFGHAGYTSADVMDFIPTDDVIADGGTDNVLPRGYCRGVGIENAGHRGFVPKPDTLDETVTYVRTDNWLSRFKDAATGDSVDKAEQEATKEFAAGDPKFSDEQLLKYSAIGGTICMGFWVVIWLAF